MTLAKLLHPKVQESFDPFYHTLPPTFASGVPQEVWGESKRGCGGQVGRWAGNACSYSKKENKRLFAAQQRQHEKRER